MADYPIFRQVTSARVAHLASVVTELLPSDSPAFTQWFDECGAQLERESDWPLSQAAWLLKRKPA